MYTYAASSSLVDGSLGFATSGGTALSGAAVAREGDLEVPFAGGRIHLNGVEESHDDRRTRPGVVYSLETMPGVVYNDSEEAMPDFVLEDVYERMGELGVRPDRIAAMRAGEQVPPPGPDEPLVEVTVVFVPPRLRSFMPEPLPEHDEWRRRNRLPHAGGVSPLHDFLLHRYAELAEALRDGTLPPVLLATPTWMSGHLDPDVLVDRLEVCAAAGVEPLPADLAQAAARGELPAEAIGRQLALVLRRTWQETRPALAALRELAEAGGHHEVWRIVRALLPGMLPGEGRRVTATHSALVAFACEVAGWTGARGEIPVIGEFARGRGKSRFVHECRRLHARLTASVGETAAVS